MEDFLQIIERRSTPGVLILDMHSRLLYSNREALQMIPRLQKVSRGGKNPSLPKEISDLCNRLKEARDAKGAVEKREFKWAVWPTESGHPYSMRAFFIGRGGDERPTHIMILVQRITDRRRIDFEKTKQEFGLSDRELEVLKLLCEGLANKEISEKLCISEYTSKDHTKHIMKKLGVSSRSQIVTSLK